MRIPEKDVQLLFDIAVSSMDFGSGFLSNEEVVTLRKIAVYLGLDPEVGTPANFRDKYDCTLNEIEERQLRRMYENRAHPQSHWARSNLDYLDKAIAQLEARPRRESK